MEITDRQRSIILANLPFFNNIEISRIAEVKSYTVKYYRQKADRIEMKALIKSEKKNKTTIRCDIDTELFALVEFSKNYHGSMSQSMYIRINQLQSKK